MTAAHKSFAPSTLLLLWLCVSACSIDGYCLVDASIPSTSLGTLATPTTIKKWRVCGPFVLSTAQNYVWYSTDKESAAMRRDFLSEIGGRETPLLLRAPTTQLRVNFNNDIKNLPKGVDPPRKNGKAFFDQTQEFQSGSVSTQILYWDFPRRFAITYAAAILNAPTPRDVVLLLPSDSPVKLWLNGSVIVDPPAGTVGHNPGDYSLARVHLNRGNNPVLLKIFSFPERNEFALHVLTARQAAQFVQRNPAFVDLLNSVVVAHGSTLSLALNLQYLAFRSNKTVMSIRDMDGKLLRSQTINPTSTRELPTEGLADGLYELTIQAGLSALSERFYVGDIGKRLRYFAEVCSQEGPGKTKADSCVVIKPLLDRMADQQMTERLDKEKPLLLLLSQLEFSMRGQSPDIKIDIAGGRVYLIAYRSELDNTLQYYYIHLPQDYWAGQSVPLVVFCPYNDHNKSFFVGPTNTLAPLVQAYAQLADRYGFAIMMPFARGVGLSSPTGMKDILEAIGDVQKRYRIDSRRLYLTGECAGGRGALLLAEHEPHRFAAVSTVNAATRSAYVPYGESDDEDDNAAPRDELEPNVSKLAHVPIRLIYVVPMALIQS